MWEEFYLTKMYTPYFHCILVHCCNETGYKKILYNIEFDDVKFQNKDEKATLQGIIKLLWKIKIQ